MLDSDQSLNAALLRISRRLRLNSDKKMKEIFFSGQLLVLLPCCPALLYFLLHILNCFIELINDDDDDMQLFCTSRFVSACELPSGS